MPSLSEIVSAVSLTLALSTTYGNAAEIRVIKPDSRPAISGKEVDWIYGDYLMKNDLISLTIAEPLTTRDANMTIRNIGASILDLTLNHPSNDQLSAYTPTAGRYLFRDPSKVKTGREGDAVFWQCGSSRSPADSNTTATVRYRLKDGDPFVESTVWIEGDVTDTAPPFDGVRADGWFEFEKAGSTAYCADSFFRQTIGFRVPSSQQPPVWKRGRPWQLRYNNTHIERTEGKLKWTVRLYPATSPLDLLSVTEQSQLRPAMHTFKVLPETQPSDGYDSVNRATIVVRLSKEQGKPSQELVTLQTDDQGVAHTRLLPGKYVAVASAIGCGTTEVEFTATADEGLVKLNQGAASGFEAVVKDDKGHLIPVKATIYSLNGDHPDFGLSSTRTFVENCVYSVHGRLHCPLDPGNYEIYFSRGPEYNSETRQLKVVADQMTQFNVQLDRVVDTTGWISADLHSHSSPSGDNTSDQYGRVENLLCEHVEFAPCTEHNRISSYTPHLQKMKLTHLMATCTGIELTGSPTPVNHQNAFPLHRHPHTQNGGGPRASYNPVLQIERLAMWDNASEKLVQMNHPNLHQIYGDSNTDGVADKGFREMLRWTDVIEVHPLEAIFQDIVQNPPARRRKRATILHWMQLLNQGQRTPGVINTDSHYNHHGSGWRRNWFACSTDDPAKISTEEMVREIEAGHIIMSNGPFLSVSGKSDGSAESAIPGDDLVAKDGKVSLKISVQCPNWLDVNRVQVFINGRPSPHNYTRKSSKELFGDKDSAVRFETSLDLELDEDAHLIVATIGEELTMENVMGQRYGRRPPVAVSNPIFVDVDGNGFDHNHDELDLPLPKAGK